MSERLTAEQESHLRDPDNWGSRFDEEAARLLWNEIDALRAELDRLRAGLRALWEQHRHTLCCRCEICMLYLPFRDDLLAEARQ